MINNRFHHYKTYESFLTQKFSASSSNTTYTYGGVGEIYEGIPDISWSSIVFIKDPGLIATHGKVYDATGKAISLKSPVTINGVDFDGSSDVVTEVWGKSRSFRIGEGTSIDVDGSGDVVLELPNEIDACVTKDSEGRVIVDTYLTRDDLNQELDGYQTFRIYSGEDDTYPTLENYPAVEWNTDDLKDLHAGDFYVTSEGKIFRFEETIENGWEWNELTDFYLYECLGEIEEIKKRVDMNDTWEKTPQTEVEESEIYVLGELTTGNYIDIVSCPSFINYELSQDVIIYFPFVYEGMWTRTSTRYNGEVHLLKGNDMSRVQGKEITISNESGSSGIITLNLGDSPEGSSNSIILTPGQCIKVKLVSDIIRNVLVYYWEYTEIGEKGILEEWV